MASFTCSDFYCLECTNKIALPRKNSRQREKDHLKAIYCINCRKIVNHYEVRDCDVFDFNLEILKDQIASGLFIKGKKEKVKIEKDIQV